MLKVQRVYHYVINSWIDEDGVKWNETDISTDEELAKKVDKNYRLATIDEVNEFVSLGDTPIKLIEVEEGIYYWVEMIEFLTVLGDLEVLQGYIWVKNNSDWEIKDLSNMIARTIE
ncbi:hypothetical protein ACR77J_08160 [Tissierella praeacuta]|uniref:hypothetical protein n=1 Tax=Tissierella praeacuta TaxID=43131 RepID=UPI003DA3C5D2